VTWNPRGIETSAAFRDYVAALREAWPVDEQALAAARSDELNPNNATA